MKQARAFFSRVAELWRKNSREQEMEEEFASVLEMETEENLRAGMPVEEARRTARMKLGIEATKEQVRDRRGLPLLESVFQDSKFGLRTLRKNPGFTAVAVITLALGIGANTAMFSAVDAVLLRAFPYRQPQRLVAIWESSGNLKGLPLLGDKIPVRMQSYLRWKQAKAFEDVAIFTSTGTNLGGIQTPERVESGQASPNFFPMLGVQPELGRTFGAEEGQPGRDRVAVISHKLWQTQFGGDATVLGRKITLDQVPYEVIGVLPATFYMPGMLGGFDQTRAEVWTPVNVSPDQPPDALQNNMYMVYARLREGTTVAQAQEQVTAMERELARESSKRDDHGAGVYTLKQEDVSEDQRRSLLVLQMAVGFVFLIACVNVANLLLARTASRETEMAVRRALGASRGRLTRQLLVESLLVSAMGSGVGMLLAWWCVRVMRSATSSPMYALKDLHLDGMVLAFTAFTAVLAAVLFGIAPALHATHQNVQEAMNRGGRSGAGVSSRFRNALVVAEIALALVPLAGAGLMIRTLHALLGQQLGFDPEHVLISRVSVPEQHWKRDYLLGFDAQVLERVKAIPGVQAAAIADGLPMQSLNYTNYNREGSTQDEVADFQDVSEEYFAAMGSPLLRGRNFTAAEASAETPSVAVVNEALARREWPNEDPIGKTIVKHGGKQQRLTVIGVVPNTHQVMLADETVPQVFVPTRALANIWLVVRGSGDAAGMTRPMTDAVHAEDTSLPVYDVKPLAEILRENVSGQRYTMLLLAGFAGLALMLAAVGLYGVLAYSVQQRTREIGVRMALGAVPRDILAMIVRQGAGATVAGVALGCAGALALTRLMAKLLFGVKPYDPMTFMAVAAVVAVVALAATYLPARRAAKVEPMEALRFE